MLKFFFVFFLLFTHRVALAACASPMGVSGYIQYLSGEYKYCDGTDWKSTSVLNTGASCSEAGLLGRNGADLRFCNGTNWISVSGSSTGSACPADQVGIMVWKSSDNRFEWCDGTNWRLMQATAVFSPPSSLSLWQNVPGDDWFTLEWLKGTLAGPCRVQYYKDELVWTDLPVVYDCNTDVATSEYLPSTDNWTNNFNSTGVKLRLVSTVSGDPYGEFPQRARCVIRPDPVSSTTSIDENCNALWNDEPDPCDGSPTPGTVCGDGSVYVATFSGARYFTTKGGCGDIPPAQKVGTGFAAYPSGEFTPTCSGNDSLQKTWNNFSGGAYDFPELVNYAGTAGIGNEAINLDANSGVENTAALVTRSTLPGGVHAAARYCDHLKIGNKTDWFVPNRFELNQMRQNRAVMPGILSSGYWSSTEYDSAQAWFQMMGTGDQDYDYKGSGYYLRCMRREPQVEICDGAPAIGTQCTSGITYAGIIDNNKYFVTPSGCTDSISPTCSGGTDAVTKVWIGSYGSAHDFVDLPNYVLATRNFSGEAETMIISMLSLFTLGVTDTAANYCNDLVYQGFSDWFLPSKSELAYLYCKASVPSHSTSNPQESANCAAFGGKSSQLTGFNSTGNYWSSSKNGTNSFRISFSNGNETTITNTTAHHVRCIRKEQGNPVAPTGLQFMQSTQNSSQGQVYWTKGSGTGGIDGCKVQYLKDGTTWTDSLIVSVGFETTILDCDQNANGSTIFLSKKDNWTNNFNSVGVSLRLVSAKTGVVLGNFPEKATCIPKAGATEKTPTVDENCDGRWDDNVGGTAGCPSGEECINWDTYTDNICTQGQSTMAERGCSSSGAISAMGGKNICLASPFGGFMKIINTTGCVYGGTFY